MAQEKIGAAQKTRIESLSDLIFGLALSIGALTLIGQPPSDFQALLISIGYYAFSFIILISLWYTYTRTMSFLRVESDKLVSLNVLMLFLVSIEPFLFNQLLSSSLAMVESISIVYAFDLGALFAVGAFFANAILADKTKPEQILYSFKLRRNTLVIGTGLFFISVLPIFWSWEIPLTTSGGGIPIRFVFWFVTLFLQSFRRLWENRNRAKTAAQ